MPIRNSRFSVPKFKKRKGDGPPLVVLTAYDAPSAMVADAAGVDALLVGDSLANVLLGYENTLPVTMDEMVMHTRSVGRVRKHALLIADMPWMSYHESAEQALRNAARFVREAHADAVKLEGGANRVAAVRKIVDAEIPVMGHVGLTPQSVKRFGGYKVQGRNEEQAEQLLSDARALVDAGVFAMVLEGIPAEQARRVTREVPVPTIGIGAGADCDGQVLVFHDLLGMLPEEPPKFVRQYAQVYETQQEAIRRWAADVRDRTFPSDEESYR